MIITASELLNRYLGGEKYFCDLDIESQDFSGQQLEGIVFERCFLSSSFRDANLRNAKFINGNVKTCDFRDADLTNALFENVAVEAVSFKGAKTEGVVFNHNWAYGNEVNQEDFEHYIKSSEP